jgi:hypothetical protein
MTSSEIHALPDWAPPSPHPTTPLSDTTVAATAATRYLATHLNPTHKPDTTMGRFNHQPPATPPRQWIGNTSQPGTASPKGINAAETSPSNRADIPYRQAKSV